MLFAERVQALLHLGAQVLLNPSVGGLEPIGFENSANLGFYTGSVAGKAQEVVAGKLDEEFAVNLPTEGENPLADIEGENGIPHPSLGADFGVEIGRKGGHGGTYADMIPGKSVVVTGVVVPAAGAGTGMG